MKRTMKTKAQRDPSEGQEKPRDLLDEIAGHTTGSALREGIVIGELTGFDGRGAPLVDYAGNPTDGALPARATVNLTSQAIGRQVALMFEAANPRRPIVLGLIEKPVAVGPTRSEPEPAQTSAHEDDAPTDSRPLVDIAFDGEQVILTSDRDIVLRCGKSSISLSREGKITIHGTHLVNRSSGVNRIKGGSVQIN